MSRAPGRSAPSIEEIRAREEARRAENRARKARRRTPEAPAREELRIDVTLFLLERPDRSLAYEGLRRRYVMELSPRHRWHDNRQLDCMRGQTTAHRLTMREAQAFMACLKPYGWVRRAS